MGFFRGFFAAIAVLPGSPLSASQAEDAAKLEELYEAAKPQNEYSAQYSLAIDGCGAEFIDGRHTYRFLLSSIDFDGWAESRDDYMLLGDDAIGRIDDWWNGPTKNSWCGCSPIPEPRDFPLYFPIDLGPDVTEEQRRRLIEDGFMVTEEEQQRLMSEVLADRRDYVRRLLAGEFGEWFRLHHHIAYDVDFEGARYPGRIAMIWSVPMKLDPTRSLELIEAMRAYVEAHCLPKPVFD